MPRHSLRGRDLSVQGAWGREVASASLSLLYGATRPVAVVATVLIRGLTLWFAVLIGVLATHVLRASGTNSL